MSTKPHFSLLATSFAGGPRPRNAALILAGLWLVIFFAAIFAPPILDDADATHAQAARAMVITGDLITLRVDGIRYLEKAPLPYWLAAASFRIFGFNTFAAHLPQALAIALLALLGHRWANQAFGSRTAFYTAIALLTSLGTFLFTRIFIPEALLSLLLAAALFAFLKSLGPISSEPTPETPVILSEAAKSKSDEPNLTHTAKTFCIRFPAAPGPLPPMAHSSQPRRDELVHPNTSAAAAIPERPALIPPAAPLYPYLMWTFLALAVLTKGLVALVFFLATTHLYLLLLGEFKTSFLKLKPLTGPILFLVIAAPWHILAARRNPGFLRFYFWNEHVLRFLGRRTPADFNRLPGYLYWTLHLVWLFPWSLFLPLGFAAIWRRQNHQTKVLTGAVSPLKGWRSYLTLFVCVFIVSELTSALKPGRFTYIVVLVVVFTALDISRRRHLSSLSPSPFHRIDPQQRTILLLSLFAAIILLFFSLSTNQEYYTFPAYLPILLLIAATITRAEQTYSSSLEAQRWITFAHAAFTTIGALAALTLLYGLFASRHLPYTPDIGTLLLRRNVAANTLTLSHLFDLTTAAFAALRLPAALAAAALLTGPALAWLLRTQRRHIAATTTIAFTSGLFLVAAHLAFVRFAPMLSSQSFAAQIQTFEAIHPHTPILIYGDQAYGSSLPFYLGRAVSLVDGRTTSMQFGSTYPDAPPIFLTPAQLTATWSQAPIELLFIPAERREEVLRLLGPNPTILRDESGKLLLANHLLP